MRTVKAWLQILRGALLIAGTTIGVGMLALPVVTGEGGFAPSLMVYFACWVFMLCTGFLLLEVCSWMPPESNLITMASTLLGKWGRYTCWLVYLFLFFCVMVAHITGGGAVLKELFPQWGASHHTAMLVYLLAFLPPIYLGIKWVDRCNWALIAGLIISYFAFVAIAFQHIDISLLTRVQWGKAWLAIPVLFTAFTFQVILPSLMTLMDRRVPLVRTAIWIGVSIPLVVYLIWEFLILGIVPVEGSFGLLAAAKNGWNAVMPLKHALGGDNGVVFIGHCFAFFTMTASYVALALSYLDFLADGLKIKKVGAHKVLLCALVFIPPLVVALFYPHLFLRMLNYAGGFSCVILFGLFPPLMAWVGRYRFHYSYPRQLWGGKWMLAFLIMLALFEVGIECFKLLYA